MIISYNDKEIKVYECNSFFSRLKGFMFSRNINKCLLFKKCNSIHTIFMFKSISVILTDRDNKILYYYDNLKPYKIILPKKEVHQIYELPPFYFRNIKINDYLVVKGL